MEDAQTPTLPVVTSTPLPAGEKAKVQSKAWIIILAIVLLT